MLRNDSFILFDNWQEFKTWLDGQTFKRKISVIQQHHTWSPSYKHFTGNNHFQLLNGMRDYHMKSNGWQDIAQQLTIFPDGKIATGRSFDIAPAGIKGCNTNGLCIESIGNFDTGGDAMTAEQKNAILGVTASLCIKLGLTPGVDTITYHHWWDLNSGVRTFGTGTTKTCPGTNFFGGNKTSDAVTNFYPAIITHIEKARNPVAKEGMKLEQWKVDLFNQCLEKGIITEKNWLDKMDEKVDAWAVMAMINNMYNKLVEGK